jgi:hypothetical protein
LIELESVPFARIRQRQSGQTGDSPTSTRLSKLSCETVQLEELLLGGKRVPGPVNYLIGSPHEPVQSVHRRPDFARQPEGRQVEGRIVPTLHSPALAIGTCEVVAVKKGGIGTLGISAQSFDCSHSLHVRAS